MNRFVDLIRPYIHRVFDDKFDSKMKNHEVQPKSARPSRPGSLRRGITNATGRERATWTDARVVPTRAGVSSEARRSYP